MRSPAGGESDSGRAGSAAELKAGLPRALALIESRLEALRAAYARTTGRRAPELLAPNAAAELQRLRALAAGGKSE